MFAGLTKADIEKLSDEQREVIARVALDQAQAQRKLKETAGGYFGYQILPLAFLFAVLALGGIQKTEYLPFVIVGLFALIQFHAIGINKRIDASLKLMAPLLEAQAQSRETPREDGRKEQA